MLLHLYLIKHPHRSHVCGNSYRNKLIGGGWMNHEQKERILLLYSNYGDGHKQAAEAIREAFTIRYPHVDVVLIDFMKYTHPLLHPISRRIFMQALKKFPFLYRIAYKKTKFSTSSHLLRFFTLLGFRRMVKLLHDTHPSVVVSSHPFAAAGMSRLKRYGFTKVPTVTVITDHTNHSFWIHPLTDAYLVGSEFARKTLLEVGVKDEIISVTGIPIRPRFAHFYDKKKIRTKYGLSAEIPTVLIMGGGWGLIDEGEKLLRTLDQFPERLQILFICGHNHRLWNLLSRKADQFKNLAMITQYIHYIDELMAASDVIITKPGGLTTSEAMALEVPMILYRPLPGQEEENAQFLLHEGAALLATHMSQLVDHLQRLLHEPHVIQQMKEREKRLALKEAAFNAAEEILNVLHLTSLKRIGLYPQKERISQEEEAEEEMEHIATDSL